MAELGNCGPCQGTGIYEGGVCCECSTCGGTGNIPIAAPDCNSPQQEQIQRFKFVTDHPKGAALYPSADGPFIRYSDHQAQLKQAIAEFAERLEGEEAIKAAALALKIDWETRHSALDFNALAQLAVGAALDRCRTLATEGESG